MKKQIIAFTMILFTLALFTGCQNNQNEFDKLNQTINALTSEIDALRTQNNDMLETFDYKYMQLSNEIEKNYQTIVNVQLKEKEAVDFNTVQILSIDGKIFKSTEINSLDWLAPLTKVESVDTLKSNNFTRSFDSIKDEVIYSKDNVSLYYGGASEYTELKWVKINGTTNYEVPRDIQVGDSLIKVMSLFPVNTDWNKSPLNVFYQNDINSETLTSEYGTYSYQMMRLVDQTNSAYMEIDFFNDVVSEIRFIMN